MHECAKEIAEKIRKRREEIMSDTSKIRQRCERCDRIIMWNAVNRREEFMSSTISNNLNE